MILINILVFFFNLTEMFLTNHCEVWGILKGFGKNLTFLLHHTASKDLLNIFFKEKKQ